MPHSAKTKPPKSAEHHREAQASRDAFRRPTARPRPAPDLPLFLGRRAASERAGARSHRAAGRPDGRRRGDRRLRLRRDGPDRRLRARMGDAAPRRAAAPLDDARLPGEGDLLSRPLPPFHAWATPARPSRSAARMTAPIWSRARSCSRGFCARAPISTATRRRRSAFATASPISGARRSGTGTPRAAGSRSPGTGARPTASR